MFETASASIRTKFVRLFLLMGLTIFILFIGALTLIFQENLNDKALADIKNIQGFYNSLEDEDIRMLSVALNTFSQNKEFKNLFALHDRDKLFAACNQLFTDNRDKYGITHFYFIDNDGTCFLRMHNQNLYGDLIDRKTFKRAQLTKNVSFGVELGQTAYALRVVMPYMDSEKLLGYVEFGEEIEHFDNIIKNTTNANVIVLARKELLSKQKYTNIRVRAGRTDEWDDLKNYVVLNNTLGQHGIVAKDIFNESEIEIIQKPTYLGNLYHDGYVFMKGAFPFYDVFGDRTGVIVILDDITDQVHYFWTSIIAITIICVLLLGVFFVTVLNRLNLMIISPLIKLTVVADMLSKGKDLEHELVTDRTDEIGMLTRAFDRMRISANTLTKRLLSR